MNDNKGNLLQKYQKGSELIQIMMIKITENSAMFEFAPKKALNEVYFTNIVQNKDDLMRLCVDVANMMHPNPMKTYLSVKIY